MHQKDGVGREVEKEPSVKCPDHFVHNSRHFVETCSTFEFDRTSLVDDFRGMVHYFFELVSFQGFKVQVLNFHYHVQSHEVYDAVLDVVLIRKLQNVAESAQDARESLNESQHVADFWAVWHKLVTLLVCKLHDDQPSGDVWSQTKMQSDGAGKFDEPKDMGVGNLGFVVAILICNNSIKWGTKHCQHDAVDEENWV